MLDFLTELCKFVFLACAAICMLFSLPFVLAHIAGHWDAPEYPHCGFCPDCPAWEEAPDGEAGAARAPQGKGEPQP